MARTVYGRKIVNGERNKKQKILNDWSLDPFASRESQHSRESKLTFPRETSLKAICFMAGNFEAGHSLSLVVKAVVGQH